MSPGGMAANPTLPVVYVNRLAAENGLDQIAIASPLKFEQVQDAQAFHNDLVTKGVLQIYTAASQAEMEAGTQAALRAVSPLRVAQAIAARLAALVASAPEALNTLSELAAALGNDENFAAAVNAAIGAAQAAATAAQTTADSATSLVTAISVGGYVTGHTISSAAAGTLNMDGSGGPGGSILTFGGSNGGANGGSLNTSAQGSGSGGTLNLSSSGSFNGGSITTKDGGGDIDTTGKGSIMWGVSGQRTTVLGTATVDRTITWPDGEGTVVITDGPGAFFINMGSGYKVNGVQVIAGQYSAIPSVVSTPSFSGSDTISLGSVETFMVEIKFKIDSILAALRNHGLIAP